jgi:hypothetical protein
MKYADLVTKIDEYEQENELVEILYSEALKRLVDPASDMRKLDEVEHVQLVIRPFLVHWGTMNRVVGRKGLDWGRLTKTLRDSEPEFSALRGKTLLSDFEADPQIPEAIAKIYESVDDIPYIGGATGTSKILHLINPEIFVMWDQDILDRFHQIDKKVQATARGYLRFLEKCKNELEEAMTDRVMSSGKESNEILNDLRSKYNGKTIAKLIDEYNENLG